MASWLEVLVAAFTLQLLVLPGEKGQLIIAGLATKYNPYVVVAGAATAFGGWTVIEILLGNALKGALPAVYLDGITAGLFVVFAAWILYSSPLTGESDEIDSDSDSDSDQSTGAYTDGGTGGVTALKDDGPVRFAGFVPSFSVMVFGEFGDKTQLITIGLAVQYGAHPAIWLGEMLAIVPVSLLTALFFDRVAHRFDRTRFHRVAAALFVLFAADITAKYVIGRSFLPF